MQLTKEQVGDLLAEYLRYNPETGHLTWIKKPSKTTQLNSRAGSYVTTTGYRSISIFGKSYPEHHVAWRMYHGTWATDQLDHINQDRSDNRIINLRQVTKAENARNRSRRNASRVDEVGIWYNRRTKKYVAEITMTIDGVKRKVFQRTFDDVEEAIKARKAKSLELGFHANHGSRNKE